MQLPRLWAFCIPPLILVLLERDRLSSHESIVNPPRALASADTGAVGPPSLEAGVASLGTCTQQFAAFQLSEHKHTRNVRASAKICAVSKILQQKSDFLFRALPAYKRELQKGC